MEETLPDVHESTEVFDDIDAINPLLSHLAPENIDWEVDVNRLKIVHRDEWGAIPARRKFYMNLPVRTVIFMYNTWPKSCSSLKGCSKILKDMQLFEMKKVGFPDVKQNFLVDDKGVVYEGRGFRVMQIAPTKYFTLDNKSISIGFIGDYRVKLEYEWEIFPRKYWGAVQIKKKLHRLRTPVPNVVLIYYTGKQKCLSRTRCKQVLFNLQRKHLRRDMDDIKYNFMIDECGHIYEGRGWEFTTPVPTKYTPLTSKCITIAYVGDYSYEEPNQGMINSALKLIQFGVKRNVVTKIHDFVTFRNDD